MMRWFETTTEDPNQLLVWAWDVDRPSRSDTPAETLPHYIHVATLTIRDRKSNIVSGPYATLDGAKAAYLFLLSARERPF